MANKRTSPLQVAYFHRRSRPNANFSIEIVFENLRRDLAGRIEPSVCVAPCYSNGLLRRLWIAWHARRRQGEINHVTGDTNFTALLLDGRRTVLTNHDCGYITRTQGLRRWLLKTFWLQLPVDRVAAVTTVSNHVKQEIVAYTGCSPDKVHVIPNAASPAFQPAPKAFNETRPRILHIGTAANKNLPRLAEAVAGLPCVLVVIGQLDRRMLRLLGERKIEFENYVDLPTAELVRQYRDCDLVSFASLSEGFGVPILEAQAVGRPVITSDRPPMDEVAGVGACLVDPLDVGAIRAAVVKASTDPTYRSSLIDAGFENIQRFDAKRIAEQYFRLYEQVLATSR